MAGLFDKQAEVYVDARPRYPSEWYSMLAGRTHHHTLAWDVGTGNGQAAIGVSNLLFSFFYLAYLRPRTQNICVLDVLSIDQDHLNWHHKLIIFKVAEYYEQVIGTDVSEAQLKHAMSHPRVRYIHTPLSISDDELVLLLGGEGSVDLVTAAEAVHWFDLPNFYSIVTRLLRKPGGILAVWGYNDSAISPAIDSALKRFRETTLPFRDPNIRNLFDGYRTLPFPFESVGLGSEGEPLLLDMPMELSFDGLLRMLMSSSAVATAKDRGVELLSEGVVKELESAWGGRSLIRNVIYKAFMLVGKPKL
ncbi:hypothetical protein HHK36_030457 [Tetracentron sinense]|uniref:Methyltransferase type 11 domain-containing protein n=1 Tax=Tetracentron sinense TaxID=13715 RepID=A0A834Y9W3_TETSI|nr:hypothetical protein HHK36_030457 [Tetracentron sinense]